MSEEYERVTGSIVRTTEKALLLMSDTLGYDIWIPKSVCGKISARELDEFSGGDEVRLFVAEWFVKKEGIT